MLNVAVRKKLLPANPCSGVEFPVRVQGLFRPHYMAWSEQQRIEFQAPEYLRNIVRIITGSGLRVYKELMPMKKDQVDLENAFVWIPDSKTPNGVAEVPLTDLALLFRFGVKWREERSPLVSIPPLWGGDFQGMRVYRSDFG
jgi:site-specific recombinase XerC